MRVGDVTNSQRFWLVNVFGQLQNSDTGVFGFGGYFQWNPFLQTVEPTLLMQPKGLPFLRRA